MMGIAAWLATKLWGRWLLKIAEWIGACIKWTFKRWERVALVGALVAVFVLYGQAESWRAESLENASKVADRDKTISDMKAASEAAKQAALANAARVEAEYREIADNAKISYDRALADNRASVERWKLQNRRSATGKGDSTAPTTGTEGIAGTEALPNIPSGFALVPESDLDKTADIQATLVALQDWARGIGKVETAPE